MFCSLRIKKLKRFFNYIYLNFNQLADLKVYILLFFIFKLCALPAQVKTIHVFVALCDNKNQGIVPVPDNLGSGQNPATNLYWGARYGVASYFKHRSSKWIFIKSITTKDPRILERLLFKHHSQEVYLLADAFDGAQLKSCTEDYLKSSNGQLPQKINYNSRVLTFGGAADLLAYVGHNGLMDFKVSVSYKLIEEEPRQVILLGCATKNYFQKEIIAAQADPLLWTNNLMAPEAYTLEAALNAWVDGKGNTQLLRESAKSYHRYQNSGLEAALRLFRSGF